VRIHYLSHGAATGYGVAAARLIRALLGAGHEVRWTPITFDPDAVLWPRGRATAFPTLEALRDRPVRPDVTVVHAVPELARPCRHVIDSPFLIHTVWETTQLQSSWPTLLDEADGVIVPTRWNEEIFRRSGVEAPIAVVPHVAWSDEDPVDTSWLPERPSFVAYTVAEWQPRKAPWRAVEAYSRAFAPDDDVLLVVKTGSHIWNMTRVPMSSPRAEHTSFALARLLGRLGRVPPILLVDRMLPFEQFGGLHRWADCWLSLPHAEGWDLGAFDAATVGNRVVTTGWGAPAEYLDHAAAWLVPVEESPVTPGPGNEIPGRWAEPDMDAAVVALREAFDPGGERLGRVDTEAARLRRTYGPESVAVAFAAAVDSLLSGRGGGGG